jgi:hypothetical protein
MRSDPNLITVRRLNGTTYQVDPAWLYINQARFDLPRNGRGYLKEAREKPRKPRTSLAQFSGNGRYFLQVLENGRQVRSLKGTPGSSN